MVHILSLFNTNFLFFILVNDVIDCILSDFMSVFIGCALRMRTNIYILRL